MRRLAIASVVLALAGCETAPKLQEATAPTTAAAEEFVWVRTDGQRGAGNPALRSQFESDVAACPGAAQRSPAAVSCMSERGYILAPISEAESLRQDFARAWEFGDPL